MSIHPTTTLLEDARQQVTFPLKEMTKLLYGDPKFYQAVMQAQSTFANDPLVINKPDYHNLSRMEQIRNSMPKLSSSNLNFDLSDIMHISAATIYFQSTIPSSVSYLMAVPAIKFLGTEEQIKEWIPKFFTQEIVAGYSQTEIGHGSDVQNLETTATYNTATNDFTIHTPTVSATKFWPGELGIMSNYALVYAKLLFNGKNKGVHPFMVQIRDFKTHKPLPGIIVGDIGPKQGYSIKDNGFLAFQNYRVPLFSLLGRYVRIENGQFSRHGNEKISYASMMIVRNFISLVFPRIAAQSLTVAIRYSIVRQQFKNDQGVENSVLEYQTQQDKLLPRLAQAYGMIFVGLKIKDLVDDNFHRVHRKDFSQMQQTHALLSASKAWSSQWVVDTAEWCRLSCGGHGYAHYSGMPGVYFETSPNVTLEGENQVLYLQVARYLLKLLQHSQKNPEKVPYFFSYLNEIKTTLTEKIESLEYLLKLNATLALLDVAKKIKKLVSEGKSFQEAWNHDVGVYLLAASQRYFEYFTYIVFREVIEKKTTNSEVKSVLEELCSLYSVQAILDSPSALIENGKIQAEELKSLQAQKEELLLKVKRQSIGLVDAFEYSDSTLKTCIGCYDGKPYERIYEWVTKENSFNKQPISQALQNLMGMKSKL